MRVKTVVERLGGGAKKDMRGSLFHKDEGL
jgi:hypothetical protein